MGYPGLGRGRIHSLPWDKIDFSGLSVSWKLFWTLQLDFGFLVIIFDFLPSDRKGQLKGRGGAEALLRQEARVKHLKVLGFNGHESKTAVVLGNQA